MKKNSPTSIIDQQSKVLRDGIIEEILFAFGASKTGIARKIIGPLIQKPAAKISGIIAEFYEMVVKLGVSKGASNTLPKFNMSVISRGEKNIPTVGPLLLISNHPGGLDSLGIISRIPRNDLKILVSDARLLRQMDHLNRYLIFVNFEAIGGMSALRDAIKHLQNDGALLLFAHGEVEPDAEVFEGAMDSIAEWSPSIEVMARKVPKTVVQIVSASGALLPKFAHHWLTRIRKNPPARQKLAEVIQIIQSVFFPKNARVNLHVTYNTPIVPEIYANEKVLPFIIQKGQNALGEHLSWVKSLNK